ncbi:MAG TPA: GNAT family N-acetyltransferase [Myxococcales bacterium]
MNLRRLTLSDARACESVALEHGWEVGEERWRLMLGLGDGWGSFAPDGHLVGTTFLFSYERRVALVAMVLVREAFGRQGLGRRLVEQAMTDAPPQTYLYATSQGRGLYERLGFASIDEDLARFSGTPRDVSVDQSLLLRPLEQADLPSAIALDADAFGASRAAVVSGLHGCSARALGAWRAGRLLGYGLATHVGGHVAIGPVAALEEAAGVQLVHALAQGHALPVRIDAPAGRASLGDWAVRAGLAREPPVPLMALGGRVLPGRRERIVAVASRGLG